MSELRVQLRGALGASYTVERELGAGGMSRVFVARETALSRQVVLKVLPWTNNQIRGERYDSIRKNPRAAAMLDTIGSW